MIEPAIFDMMPFFSGAVFVTVDIVEGERAEGGEAAKMDFKLRTLD